MRNMILQGAVLLVCAVGAYWAADAGPVVESAGAADSDAGTNRTVITSDTLVFDYNRRIAEFEGNVKVRDSQVEMNSKTLVVFFDQTNSIKFARASGDVVFVGGGGTGECQRAVYYAVRGEITMLDGARVTSGSDVLEGGEMTFFLNDGRIKVHGGSRLNLAPGRDAVKPEGEHESEAGKEAP